MKVMTPHEQLRGQRVLVLEDDYFLAMDTAEAVRAAGGLVVGPSATELSAMEQIASARPTAALLDVNLGSGPSFELARMLQRRGIPFAFLTGYDPEIIPAEFAGVERIEKPTEPRRILACLARLIQRGPDPRAH
jgi:DNA-binding response OmpR family regulator